MFERAIGSWRRVVAAEMRVAAVGVAAFSAAAVTLGLLCAALFVVVMDRYNVLYACLSVAVVFFGIAAALFVQYLTARDEAEREAAASRTTRQSLLVDPFVLATGVQIIRAIGIKKAVTLLAVVGTGVAQASRTWSPDRFEELDQRQN